MNIEHLKNEEVDIAVVSSDEIVIADVQSALNLMMDVKYETGTAKIAIEKKAVCDDFFIPGTGMAEEILQKFVNYRVKIAIYGDDTKTSESLQEFIRTFNNGSDFFFVPTKEEAIQKLTEAK